jgi:hypothetical protein
LDHRFKLPESGSFQAVEPITSQLFGSAVNGLWTLAIADSRINNKTGTLVEWALNFQTQYCTEGYQWTLLYPSVDETSWKRDERMDLEGRSTSIHSDGHFVQFSLGDLSRGRFRPRYGHTAIAVGNDVYVIDGRADELYFDTWRFDYNTRDWTQLKSEDSFPHRSGQSAVLTPFGLLTFGGLDENNERSERKSTDVLRYDILNRTWSKQNLSPSITDIPQWRYLTALCYVGDNHLLISPQELRTASDETLFSNRNPTMIMLGGDSDSYDQSLLPELWAYSMKENEDNTRTKDYKERKKAFCKTVFFSTNEQGNNRWEWSCGSFGDSYSETACTWMKLVERAWCLGQFQSFYMPNH